ncbi:MAG: hypothetical protein E6I45_03380 [Chloroflexi bacterium]|nr:MAG: hypothetical protein E6I45_03380 [Chloroflexota bacterium]
MRGPGRASPQEVPSQTWNPWDYADGQTYVAGMFVDSIKLRASAFECPVCRLVLQDATLEQADLNTVIFRQPAFDGQLAYSQFRRVEAEDQLGDWDR